MTEIKRPQEMDKKTEMSTGGGVLPDVKGKAVSRVKPIRARTAASGRVL